MSAVTELTSPTQSVGRNTSTNDTKPPLPPGVSAEYRLSVSDGDETKP